MGFSAQKQKRWDGYCLYIPAEHLEAMLSSMNLVLWMKRAILLVLVSLIFVCTWEVYIFICVDVIVHVPWDLCEGQRETSDVPEFHFTCWKQGALCFPPMYVRLIGLPVSEDSSVFASHLLLGALRVETCTTIVRFMCLLRIQTQIFTLRGSDFGTETPPLQPAKEHLFWSTCATGENTDGLGHTVAGRYTHHNELHQTCQSSPTCSHKQGEMQCTSCPGTKNLWLLSKSQWFLQLCKTKTITALSHYCQYISRQLVAT